MNCVGQSGGTGGSDRSRGVGGEDASPGVPIVMGACTVGWSGGDTSEIGGDTDSGGVDEALGGGGGLAEFKFGGEAA